MHLVTKELGSDLVHDFLEDLTPAFGRRKIGRNVLELEDLVSVLPQLGSDALFEYTVKNIFEIQAE